ncbi:hypothetical protein [Rhodalgimonas zhirmunskyi]|uniref:Uncharacterized protein n=1 Tax=Rhodalgimonas zhirmunskyi TaxID=2964767 RepID=A0AAJ1UAH6_9RHOB|nr:hypothetical protein [Rhodoalgimonas zhirmunskyi]MDQ2094288.1 hypothetical protein [Rhodoalgimonas zhirmunskyi]
MKSLIAILVIVGLSACKSEQQSADEISTELYEFSELAKKDRHYDMAKRAINAALEIQVIRMEENLDACDYFAYGDRLMRKP